MSRIDGFHLRQPFRSDRKLGASATDQLMISRAPQENEGYLCKLYLILPCLLRIPGGQLLQQFLTRQLADFPLGEGAGRAAKRCDLTRWVQ